MDINQLENEAIKEISQAETLADIDNIKIKYLSRKSELNLFLRDLKNKPLKERTESGQLANNIKQKITLELEGKRHDLQEQELSRKIAEEQFDVTAPGKKIQRGHLHPITLVRREVEKIFHSMGFDVIEGPEIETEWYDFDALNVPSDHPARDMQDTFWLKQPDKDEKDPRRHLLPRTHTSAVQVRYMEKNSPPFRIIAPGRVFRNEATDATHEMQFYTFEGLMVGRDVSLANLKGVLEYFARKFFKDDIEIKFNASYFPYTEPSVEVLMKGKKGKLKDRWIEMAGAGMVHRNVFKNAGYVPEEWQGFAFGMTIDRLAMLKYGIDDIRLLYGSDLRFLKQF